MHVVGFSFWMKVGLSTGLFGMAALLLVLPALRQALFGFEPSGEVLGPVIAVLVQGGLLVAIVAAINLCRSNRPAAQMPPLRAAVHHRSDTSETRSGAGAFDLAATGIPD